MKTFTAVFTLAVATLIAVPAAADPWKDESGNGRYHKKKGPPHHAKHGKSDKYRHYDEHHKHKRRDDDRRGHQHVDDPYWRVIIDMGGILGGLTGHSGYSYRDDYYEETGSHGNGSGEYGW